ncbi:MAG TPA: hypothetical protein DEQ40_05755 [Oxalobacteraceae bacterium]|jgi:hypothetical protein|nr:hypothetical protein [Oxalobacteraceae bacterium]
MVNMNIKDDDAGMCCSSDYNSCPTIYLSDAQCEALGVTTAPAAGTVYTIQCKAVAISVTSSMEEADEAKTEGDAPDVRLTLQITDMELSGGAEKSAASILYGST